MNNKLLYTCSPVIALAIIVITPPAHAGLTFTYENPGVQSTTVAGVTTETFDARPLGALSGSILGGAGSLSSGGAVVPPTSSGGAYGGAGTGTPASITRFYAVGAQSGNAGPVTLTFPSPEKYFGMFWMAGDPNNTLSFYNGASLLGSYTVATILAGLPAAYSGNPNNGLDASEKFVYLDFTATGTDSITSVIFGNGGSTGSGFEMDNFSVTPEPITPPGNSVPDSGSSLLMLGAAFGMILSVRRGFKS
jgi:hypothetical protein